MLNHRLLFRTARKLSRGGFTLVELLVVIGIIAILAGVALGPITSGIEKAKESAAMQTARSINLLMFQYSTDNSQTYPSGTDSKDVCIALLNGKYATDPTLFSLTAASKYTGSGQYSGDFLPNNTDWDFTAATATATGGVTTSASDLLPLVFCTGVTVQYPTTALTTAYDLNLAGNTGVFKQNGIAVAYKGNNAIFIKGTTSGSSSVCKSFISTGYNDTTSYVQLKTGH